MHANIETSTPTHMVKINTDVVITNYTNKQ